MRRAILLAAAASAIVLSAAWGADWSEWRGCNRTGVALTSPPLVDKLDKDTLKKAWESEDLGGGYQGGFAQPVILGDRVYIVEDHRHEPAIATRMLAKDALAAMGWAAGMPEDLVKSVEAARTSEDRTKLKSADKEIRPWADAWVKANLPKEQRKFTQAVMARLTLGAAALPLDTLAKLDPIAGKEFASHQEFEDWMKERGLDAEAVKEVMKRVPTTTRAAETFFWALERATGKTIYKKEFPGQWMYHNSASTPCIVDGRAYFLTSAASAVCADAATGEKVWISKILGNPGHSHNRSSSPLVLGGKVIISSDSALYALDARTGDVLWTNPRATGKESAAVAWKPADKQLILFASANAKKVVCLDVETGKEVWSAPSGGGASTPVIVGDVAVFAGGTDDVGLAAYRITAESATLMWNVPFKDVYPSPVVDKGFVYITGDNKALCVELATGVVKWQEELKGATLTSPVLADGKLIVLAAPDIAIIRATPDKFELLGRAKVNPTTWASPGFADGFLFLRTNKNVACYDLRKP